MQTTDLQGMTRTEALDRLSINEKIAHFARKDAFRLPRKPGENWGAPIRLKRVTLPGKLGPGGIDAAGGNVRRQSYPVVGRPCHGIPTARLVHGRDHMIRKNGKLAFARCGECPIKASCQFIVNERLNANERIREAHREFERRGGAVAFWSRDHTRSRAPGAALQVLVRELQAVCFTSVNDSAVAAHYDELARARRERDAERQRAFRERTFAKRERETDGQHRDLIAEAIDLRNRVEAAQAEPGCQRWLANLDAGDAARVWAIRTALSAQGVKHGATHIAAKLKAQMPELSDDALRFRTARILRRMPQIEALPGRDQNPSRT
jgi:hypothetical protein